MSKVCALYHIVFCTKKRKMTINFDHREDLYRFIWKEVESTHSRLIRVGGIENHVHMLVDLHPTVTLSSLMQKVKSMSSIWMSQSGYFPLFEGWAGEYYASTVSPEHKNAVVEYIKSQPLHHQNRGFTDEVIELPGRAGVVYNEQNMQ